MDFKKDNNSDENMKSEVNQIRVIKALKMIKKHYR